MCCSVVPDVVLAEIRRAYMCDELRQCSIIRFQRLKRPTTSDMPVSAGRRVLGGVSPP